MNNTNSNSSCTLNNNNNNNSNIPSPVAINNVQSPNNSQLSQQSKMTDSHQSSIVDELQQRTGPILQQQIPQSVFTIEQIELIRRLRKTNLTINQFIEAYSEMERLEEEEMIDKKDLSFDNTASSITYALNNNSNLTNHGSGQIVHPTILAGHYSNTNSHNQLGNLSNPYGNLVPNHSLQQLNNSFQSFDDNIELIHFKKKGEQQMLIEIRAFVSKYNVRQSMISDATGISQRYISTFLHGEKMSEKRKNIIYQWYLTYSKNPAKLASDRQQMSLNSSGNSKFNHEFGLDSSNHFNTNNDVLFPITRRDRFIFRKQHLKILEAAFELNPYPEIHTKEQIVEDCNLSAEKASGKPLKEADKVTVSIVSNWFNNKRKNARSKHIKQQFNSSNNLAGLTLKSYSLNSSIGSTNLSSQSSNTGYLNNNIQNSPSSTSDAYLTGLQQQQQQQQHTPQSHTQQLQQQSNHQQDSFESNYGYECNNYSNPDQNQQANNQANSNNQMHIVRNTTNNTGIQQFKNEPTYSYMDNCYNKMPNTSSTNSKSDNENDLNDLGQDHDGSNISEFSSQASFNGNDSIDN